ncbi:hypothetical protein F511_04394 [Dorcoceras hygrometricum]|uniref:Uncharacterized protein n=1 Tax=Dorcoceras hygrometricum TaxID=472368 RepID=A0A2Z7BKR3_9LAMI|nr:hypothetical protein F511_04394 [Dorcoceras hygrometricum]
MCEERSALHKTTSNYMREERSVLERSVLRWRTCEERSALHKTTSNYMREERYVLERSVLRWRASEERSVVHKRRRIDEIRCLGRCRRKSDFSNERADFTISPAKRDLLCMLSVMLCSEIAPSAPRTRAAAALRTKQIVLDNQGRTIRRLRAQLATERRGLATTKKELEDTQVALEASHKVIVGLTEIGLSMSKKIEKMNVKKQQVRANHLECHQKFQARIHEAEDSMQAQHLLIEALVDEKDSLLQTIHGLKEANNAPAPFDGDWEEEPEEEPEQEEIEDIPLGEGEIDDE